MDKPSLAWGGFVVSIFSHIPCKPVIFLVNQSIFFLIIKEQSFSIGHKI